MSEIEVEDEENKVIKKSPQSFQRPALMARTAEKQSETAGAESTISAARKDVRVSAILKENTDSCAVQLVVKLYKGLTALQRHIRGGSNSQKTCLEMFLAFWRSEEASFNWVLESVTNSPKDLFWIAFTIFNLFTATVYYLVVFDGTGTVNPGWTSVLG